MVEKFKFNMYANVVFCVIPVCLMIYHIFRPFSKKLVRIFITVTNSEHHHIFKVNMVDCSLNKFFSFWGPVRHIFQRVLTPDCLAGGEGGKSFQRKRQGLPSWLSCSVKISPTIGSPSYWTNGGVGWRGREINYSTFFEKKSNNLEAFWLCINSFRFRTPAAGYFSGLSRLWSKLKGIPPQTLYDPFPEMVCFIFFVPEKCTKSSKKSFRFLLLLSPTISSTNQSH